MLRPYVWGCFLMCGLILTACNTKPWLDPDFQVQIARIDINTNILLKDHHIKTSRRRSLAGKHSIEHRDAIRTSNSAAFKQALEADILTIFDQNLANVVYQPISKELSLISTIDYQKLIKNKKINAVLDIRLEFNIKNHQPYAHKESKFYSKQRSLHWSDRVIEPRASIVETLVFLNYYDTLRDKIVRHTLVIETEASDIEVVWSDLKSLDLMASEWFKQVRLDVTQEIGQKLTGK